MEDLKLRFFTQEEIDFRERLVPVLQENGLSHQAHRLKSCASQYNTFRCKSFEDHKESQRHDIAFPYYCEQRICDRCCKKRGYAIRKMAIEILKHRNKTSRNKFALLTVTKNMSTIPDLGARQVRQFNKDVRKLINTLYPKSKDCGAMAVLEFGKKLNMHAHIITYGPYYQQTYISRKWKEITGDSYIVHIQAIRGHKRLINYLVKYIAKSPKFDNLQFYSAYLKAITGVRRLHRYGIFYGFKAEQVESLKCPYCGGDLRYLWTADPINLGTAKEYTEVVENLTDKKMEA